MKRKAVVASMILTMVLMGCGGETQTTEEVTGSSEALSIYAQEDVEASIVEGYPRADSSQDSLDKTDSAKETDSANLEDSSGESEKEVELSEAAPIIDITGCTSFEQIIDNKLSEGMGYATVKIDGADVLLVSSSCYDKEGTNVAVNSTIFVMSDTGKIVEAGKIMSGGSAYPVSVKGNYLYTAADDIVTRYVIDNDNTVWIDNSAYVEYDDSNNATYYSRDMLEEHEEKDYTLLKEMYEEFSEAQVIEFAVK
ncbi:hypothetical protein [Butyrivibrio proteoclasticus]|uniref:hypothetical protein n=1 Tax=Butyrivibrio proteoclasticus TaxID=43305 RepID=UPI00047DB3A1|nr:hypothetical protein [Butyrivibrio proteoclasticus]